jgi:hypothetical protein
MCDTWLIAAVFKYLVSEQFRIQAFGLMPLGSLDDSDFDQSFPVTVTVINLSLSWSDKCLLVSQNT